MLFRRQGSNCALSFPLLSVSIKALGSGRRLSSTALLHYGLCHAANLEMLSSRRMSSFLCRAEKAQATTGRSPTKQCTRARCSAASTLAGLFSGKSDHQHSSWDVLPPMDNAAPSLMTTRSPLSVAKVREGDEFPDCDDCIVREQTVGVD